MSVAKRLSPAASLLRQSRLMAMPAPVPSPPSYFLNNPDVSPHPTVQAITTPKSSHARGNWGLKRDLPKKTKYPFLRYTSLDTLEHFMDYESAADDVLTLKKWQEMDIPILKGPAADHSLNLYGYAKKETVFDSTQARGTEEYKWRYEGPYLPDMPAGEFQHYIETQIKPRRKEFLIFVAKYQHEFAQAHNTNDPDGLEGKSPAELKRAADEKAAARPEHEIDPADVDILALRADTFLLEKLVLAFLDIPFYSRPHRTHPSAGLHYTRSSAHIRNDPTEGPTPMPKAVQGRSINYYGASGSLVGIGGIVAKATDAGRLDETSKVHNNRYNVRKFTLGRAKLDALGRVLLEVDMVNEDGSQGGNFAGYRSGMYSRPGDTRGETAAELLGTVPRNYGSMYDSSGASGMSSPKRRAPQMGQTQDVMDLLRGFVSR